MPPEPETKTLSGWMEFANFVEKIGSGKPYTSRYIFRGQADADWGLHPRLLRYAKTHGLGVPHTFEIEGALMRAFQRMAHLHIPHSVLPSTNVLWSQWWVLMQHFGAPTRVLDWTLSPYVALYFAVEKEFIRDGAVWIVHIGAIADHMKKQFEGFDFPAELLIDEPIKFWSQDVDRLFIPEPAFQMDRMAAQQYVFTVSPKVLADHGRIIDAAQPPRSGATCFAKLIIPAALKKDLLKRLKEMNVTAAALFPGLDGLGRSIAELTELSCDHWADRIWSGKG